MSSPSVRIYSIILLILLSVLPVRAFTPTGVAPAFFGPNALPVIDMSDGRTYDQLRLELAADGYFGYKGDRTADIFARVRVPLFTRWANLSIWMPVYGWYSQSDGTGSGAGDVYLSTDIQVLHPDWFHRENTKYIPQMTVRIGVKTASGEQTARFRHYDSPAYFFDLAIGNSFYWNRFEMRVAGSAGFLCWQTAADRQNDAVMYGLQLLLKYDYLSLQTTWGGYVGWERYGDAPMSLKLKAAGHVKNFEPFVQYQWGIQDYPYHQLRVGLAYHFDILKGK